MKGKIMTTVFAALLLAVLPACERKVLLDEDIYADVALTADTSSAIGGALYRALTYDAATGRAAGFAFVAADGGTVPAPAGLTTVVLHTFGCESAVVSGEDHLDSLRAYTHAADAAQQQLWASLVRREACGGDAAALAPLSSHVAWEPDAMWCAVLDSLPLPHRGPGERLVLTAAPAPLYVSLGVRLRGVEGVQHLSAAQAWIDGAHDARLLRSGATAGAAAVPFRLFRDGDDLVGTVRCFGVAPGALLQLLLTDSGGASFRYAWRLSSLEEGPDGLLTADSGIVVDEPAAPSGGGFLPTLEDWLTKVVPVRL